MQMPNTPDLPRGGFITVTATVNDARGRGTFDWKSMAFAPAIFTADDAPVAARVPSSYTFPSLRGDGTADIRVLDGSFYLQRMDSDGKPLTVLTPYLGDYIRLHCGGHPTAEEASAAMLNGAARIIDIDGQLWYRTDEPRLIIHPEGIWIDIIPDTNLNARASEFALTETGQAIARAAELRLESGTGQEPYPSALDVGVTVLIPSAFNRKAGHDGAGHPNGFRPDTKTIPPETRAKLHRRQPAGDSPAPAADQ